MRAIVAAVLGEPKRQRQLLLLLPQAAEQPDELGVLQYEVVVHVHRHHRAAALLEQRDEAGGGEEPRRHALPRNERHLHELDPPARRRVILTGTPEGIGAAQTPPRFMVRSVSI